MTEGIDATAPAPQSALKKRGGSLNSLLLADLKAMAGALGVKGTGSMKKAQLVEAIKAVQDTAGAPRSRAPKAAPQTEQVEIASGTDDAGRQADEPQHSLTQRTRRRSPKQAEPMQAEPKQAEPMQAEPKQTDAKQDSRADHAATQAEQADQTDHADQADQAGSQDRQRGRQGNRRDQHGTRADRQQQSKQDQPQQKQDPKKSDAQQNNQGNRQNQQTQQSQQNQQGGRQAQQADKSPADKQQAQQGDKHDQQDQGGEEGGRNRRRRGRERADRTGRQRNEPDTTVLEDDVLVPAAGILDVLENYAFVRTSGYAAGAEDVYLSLSMVRKFGLRRGDAVVGQVRQPREGERREKFNPMVRIDSVNGSDPESTSERPDFDKLTPVHPAERLRLETDAANVAGRVIDLAAPLGKGQRGLLVAPTRTGRTTLLQSIATAISHNNPECHLMVVLLDERPEEVTDFQRSVKGEVIASTFDRPATDHTMVAELAIERAKRLVELGHDVVVLMDGITRLARAYNLSTAASGRSLRGGVDAATMHPTKQFFGAARNVEDGGSLTILATALVGSGSETDEVIFDEFRSAENWELRLSADLAGAGNYPAIDVLASSTRREDLLVGEQEHEILAKLRRTLSGGTPAEALEKVLARVTSTQTNIELLTQVQR